MSGQPHERQELLDAWRAVTARRRLEGRLPLASMQRLRDSLLQPEGDAQYVLQFDRDSLQVPYAELQIETELPLQCQRSLQRFLQPVRLVQRLGLIREEADEAGLPEGYEPLLMPPDGMLNLADLVEDELILAVPVIAVKPGTQPMQREWHPDDSDVASQNPFAVLAALKDRPEA